ncbi:MAG: FAD-dependent oxidoreductase [Planctomycetes bacterium]|nr:FAD-dependent oxidoreductase [Planctomycetota bacterium]
MAGNKRFENLLEPYHIGPVKIRNRIIKTAAETGFFNKDDGYVNGRMKAFYEAQAKGGAGAVYVEGPGIDYPLGKTNLDGIRIDDDKYISGLSELTDAIHKHNCPAFVQLLHAGPWHRAGWQPVAASASDVSERAGMQPPRELSISEIEGIVEQFASAAERAQKAGFDGVDINAAAAHLLSTFLSRHWNKREDAYGCQSLETRARIVIEIIHKIKKRLGQDYPVGVVINGVEYGGDGAMTIEESRELAQIVEQVGADSIQVRSYVFGNIASLWPEQLFYPEPLEHLPEELDWSRTGAGAFVPVAAAVKQAVSIPVITVGRLDPALGEKVLREGKADFIGMCRRLLADPDLPNKVASGRIEDIAPCTACLNCLESFQINRYLRCRVNSALGKEREYEIKPAKKKKRVLIIGGGPGGMEAARVSALRGYDVTLHAREHSLGGLLPTAALVKGLEIENLSELVKYFETQMNKLGVKVKLGKDVNPSEVEKTASDAVILATGGLPSIPDIPGIDGSKVVSNADLHQKLKFYLRLFGPQVLRKLTKFWMPVGKKVIIIGGEMQGCELAEFLVKRGRQVTIVEESETMGDGICSVQRLRLLEWLKNSGVTIRTEVKYDQITDIGLVIITKDGVLETFEADTLIPALPIIPNIDLLKALEGKIPEIYAIGDCQKPGLITDAVADGARVGHSI